MSTRNKDCNFIEGIWKPTASSSSLKGRHAFLPISHGKVIKLYASPLWFSHLSDWRIFFQHAPTTVVFIVTTATTENGIAWNIPRFYPVVTRIMRIINLFWSTRGLTTFFWIHAKSLMNKEGFDPLWDMFGRLVRKMFQIDKSPNGSTLVRQDFLCFHHLFSSSRHVRC